MWPTSKRDTGWDVIFITHGHLQCHKSYLCIGDLTYTKTICNNISVNQRIGSWGVARFETIRSFVSCANDSSGYPLQIPADRLVFICIVLVCKASSFYDENMAPFQQKYWLRMKISSKETLASWTYIDVSIGLCVKFSFGATLTFACMWSQY